MLRYHLTLIAQLVEHLSNEQDVPGWNPGRENEFLISWPQQATHESQLYKIKVKRSEVISVHAQHGQDVWPQSCTVRCFNMRNKRRFPSICSSLFCYTCVERKKLFFICLVQFLRVLRTLTVENLRVRAYFHGYLTRGLALFRTLVGSLVSFS